MKQYREIEGDLIKLAKEGHFDVITHGCNCFCRMKRGIAPEMAKAFGCDKFKLETKVLSNIGNFNKLGNIDYKSIQNNNIDRKFMWVVNSYTQYDWNSSSKPLDYEALTLCLRKINYTFKGMHVGLPQIGCGLAGGDWNIVKSIIQKELKDMFITIVHYKP